MHPRPGAIPASGFLPLSPCREEGGNPKMRKGEPENPPFPRERSTLPSVEHPGKGLHRSGRAWRDSFRSQFPNQNTLPSPMEIFSPIPWEAKASRQIFANSGIPLGPSMGNIVPSLLPLPKVHPPPRGKKACRPPLFHGRRSEKTRSGIAWPSSAGSWLGHTFVLVNGKIPVPLDSRADLKGAQFFRFPHFPAGGRAP